MTRVRLLILLILCAAAANAQSLGIATDASLPAAAAGAAYSRTLTATGGSPPYSWRFPLGELVPPFLSISAAGVLSGTPSSGDAGKSYSFRVQVTDSAGQIAIKAFNLAVQAVSAPPLAITTVSPLPGGAVGVPYSYTLGATGGRAPYNWSLVSGDLPPGLALDSTTGAMTGKPSGPGSFRFTVGVRDASGSAVVQEFRIEIRGEAGVMPFAAGPLPSASAPMAVAVDSARGRAYVVQRSYYADVAVNPGVLPSDAVTVVEGGKVVTTIPVGRALIGDGQGIAVDSARGRIYVTNADDGTVSVIDAASNSVVQTVPVGAGPKGIDVEPATGQVYVANSESRNVSVLSASGAVVGTVPLSGGAYAVAVDRTTRLAYITASAQPWTVVVLEGTTKRAEVPLPLLSTVKAITIDPGARAFVSDHNTGMVAVIDVSRGMPREVNRFSAGAYPDAIAVDPTTHLLWAANLADDQVSAYKADGVKVKSVAVQRGPAAIAIDPGSRQAYVAVALSNGLNRIDLEAQAVRAVIPLATLAAGLALDTAGRRLYAANLAADAVSVLDPASHTALASWPCGAAPWAIAVDPALQQIYTLNTGESSLAVLNAANGAVKMKLKLGPVDSGVIAVSPSTHRVYVSSGSVNSGVLTVVDGYRNEVIAAIRVGERPVGVAIDDAAGRIYVANQQSGTISVIDAGSNQVVDTWRPELTNVWGLAIDPGLQQLYVTIPPNVIGDVSGIGVLDTTTGAWKGAIATGNRAEMAAVNPRTGHVFVTDSSDSTVTAIDGSTLAVLATFPVGSGARDLVVDADSGQVYVGNVFDGAITAIQDKPDLASPTTAVSARTGSAAAHGGRHGKRRGRPIRRVFRQAPQNDPVHGGVESFCHRRRIRQVAALWSGEGAFTGEDLIQGLPCSA